MDRVVNDIKYDNKCNGYFREKRIERVKFNKCIFRNVTFDKSIFNNVTFEECVFINTIFNKTYSIRNNFIEFFSCQMFNTVFEKCHFTSLFIKSCRLDDVKYRDTYMKGANLVHNNYIRNEFINDCNLMNVLIIKQDSYFDISFINDKSFVKLNYGTYIGEYNFKSAVKEMRINKDMFLNVSNSYMNIGDQFTLNRVMGKYEICFYQGRRALHYTLSRRGKIKSFIYDVTCGYGERPGRAFILSLFIVLTFSIIYLLTGISTSKGILSIKSLADDFSFRSLIEHIVYPIYFSMVTFATVGYGDIIPNGILGKIASVTEIVIGILMVGIWTSTLVRKMTR